MAMRKRFLSATVAPAFFLTFVLPANAYSITTGGATAHPVPQAAGSTNFNFSNGFQSLSTPFEDFVRRIQSVDNTNVNVGTAVPPVVTATAQNWFQQFDNWLYGIIGFHISTVLDAILNVFAWVLDFAKQIVDWLLSVIHQH